MISPNVSHHQFCWFVLVIDFANELIQAIQAKRLENWLTFEVRTKDGPQISPGAHSFIYDGEQLLKTTPEKTMHFLSR